ncbi:MAG: hypothetical protein JSW41_03375 [Candidatus Aenigmatarchaeota archaeon]|nr:MAG: hypothetical protein JSW41_03375 [Candidatus Aenigmarchaeota archaeon]
MKDFASNPSLMWALGIFAGVCITRIVDGNPVWSGIVFGLVAGFIGWVIYKLARG